MPPATYKTSVSLDRGILPAAKARAKSLGFGKSFSAYIVKLIEEDLAANMARSEASHQYDKGKASAFASAIRKYEPKQKRESETP